MRNLTKYESIEDLLNMSGKDFLDSARDNLMHTLFDREEMPCNIVEKENGLYTIEMPVTGFSKDDLDINYLPDSNMIEIKGNKEENFENQENGKYLHRGWKKSSFVQRFNIGKNTKVQDACIKNGVLSIDLLKENVKEKAEKIKLEETN